MEEILEQQSANCVKVVLFGPESTGKTSLCTKLAQYYGTAWVQEFMRGYLEGRDTSTPELVRKTDLLPIARGQMEAENRAALNNKLLFCDTDLLQLKVYSEYYFEGYCPEPIALAAKLNQYNLYLLCDMDIPWEPDPLRDRPFDRLTLFRIFKAELEKYDRSYIIISGDQNKRLHQAIAAVNQLLKSAC